MQLGLHNHDNEFKELDGVLIYDELLKIFDTDLVQLQVQVAVISLGYEADKYFSRPQRPGVFRTLAWRCRSNS